MPIDDKLSDQFRVLLGMAIQNRVEDFMSSLPEVGYQPYESMLALAIRVTGHVVIAAGERYPNDADLEKAAGIAAKAVTGLPIDADEIHAYLSKVVFGEDRVMSLSDDKLKASVIPMFALANLLLAFTPKGMNQWTYLDVIEASIDAVDNTNEGVLPSMVYEFGRRK
ncbi:MAG: hypothetical protein J2P25_14525 [Nocardiopsaceae bacterium]|nr:hypothetical protein [Nocardiopsaceae bacterium]